MALRFPARTKGTTSQTGSLSVFTITEPVTAGWRTFTKATSDLDIANGDTCGLIIVDTTVTNGVNLLQVVTATWNNTTKQFTVTQNHQPSVPPSWGAGVRDVVCIDNPALFLLLAGGTMTGVFNILINGGIISPSTETALVVQRSGGASSCAASVISSATGNARLNLGRDLDEDRGGVYYNNFIDELVFRTNNSDRVKISSGGALRDVTNNPYDKFAGGGVIKLPFYVAVSPDLWTKDTSNNDKALRVVSGAGSGTGGIHPFSTAVTEDHELTTAEMPAHSHSVRYESEFASSGLTANFLGLHVSAEQTVQTTDQGESEPHSHSISLQYIDVIICSKN
jgi:hypothetical protein